MLKEMASVVMSVTMHTDAAIVQFLINFCNEAEDF